MDCPSTTAWRVAQHRAKHQILDNGAIFRDPLACPILGINEQDPDLAHDQPDEKSFRSFLAIRSRIAEDKLSSAIQHGTKQVVILGGGLDTLGLRGPSTHKNVTFFEVDSPTMHVWKQRHLAKVGVSAPSSLIFVSVDFETDTLKERLISAGVDATQPVFFSWLGVVPYLSRASIERTLQCAATFPDSDIVFDYGEPIENYSGQHRAIMEKRSKLVESFGEPWISRFQPAEIHSLLQNTGFYEILDFDRNRIASYFGWPPVHTTQKASPHVVYARTHKNKD